MKDKGYRCEECGIILLWKEVQRIFTSDGKEHRVCIDCACNKYGKGG